MLKCLGLSKDSDSFGNRWLLPGNASMETKSIEGIFDYLYTEDPGKDDYREFEKAHSASLFT
jgi:hypothetical protein